MASAGTTTGSASTNDEPRQPQTQVTKPENNGNATLAESSTTAKPAPPDTARTSNPLKARKRTKTGCLTCRKRRIKCGEERPTCSNCVKSKRNCEGYTPRVIFKDPLNAFRPGVGAPPDTPPQFHQFSNRDPTTGQFTQMQSISANQVPLPVIAPRPSAPDDYLGSSSMAGMAGHGTSGDPYNPYGFSYNNPPYIGNELPPPIQHRFRPRADSQDMGQDAFKPELSVSNLMGPYTHPNFSKQGTGESDSGIDVNHPAPSSQSSTPSNPSVGVYASHGRYGTSPTVSSISGPSVADPSPQVIYPNPPRIISPDHWRKPAQGGYQEPWSSTISPQPIDARNLQNEGAVNATNEGVRGPVPEGGDPRLQKPGDHYIFQFPMHHFSTMEDREDDYWDVDSDEEILAAQGRMAAASSADLGLMLALSANKSERGIRSLHSFLNEPNVLSTYHPVYTASPLMDSQTARVFCHFVTATAPTLSLCERHPANPSIMFQGTPVPISQRSLWTYTLPMLALSHQGLLHAMLALASLHIAKLQQTSPTPSLKHYHFALRRVAKALSNPEKRQEVATLAATLLLGFYEVTTAEHNKWNSHLAGARQLVTDIDFVGMGRRAKAHKIQMEMNRRTQQYYGGTNGYDPSYNGPTPNHDSLPDENVDENIVSAIMGFKTGYSHHGRVLEESDSPPPYYKPPSAKEREDFETQCDLFWWYCKQDMYQSMVSGNRLLMSYERWSLCPPRAPIGKLDAVVGTMDHLILLVARIADFGGKDVKRKIRVEEGAKNAQQGIKPEPNYPISPAASQGGLPGWSQVSPHMPQQLPMYGMMPTPGPVRLPPAFKQEPQETTYRKGSPEQDEALEAATKEAEYEWNDICNALDVFERNLGPDYQPLSPDHMPPLSTPFGPALYYRAYSISCVWALFYTARIMSARLHPSMPPAAMTAAGVAAPRTAAWANIIGRICAGIQPHTNTHLNPTHGAALMDSCMGLFHAGVQYRDAAQRGWTITKLREVARLTGWQTSALIASGCERSWMRAAELGVGPPYQRTMNVAAKDDRVAGRCRDPTAKMYPPKDNNDRRFITVNPGTRVYWAIGILSVEEDMKALSLKD